MSKEDKQEILTARLDRMWKAASDNRKQFDWKWFMYDLWVDGDHYAKYDKNTQQIITSPKLDGRPKVVINMIYTTLRAVRNYALRNRPRPEVIPENLTQEAIEAEDKALYINKFLDFYHDKARLRLKLKATVWDALKYSVGFWQVLWDEDAEDGNGEIIVNEIDPYDLYFDPSARNEKEARYAILAVRRSLDDLKNNEIYDQEKVKKLKSDNKLAASDLKERILTKDKGSSQYSNKEDGTIITKEYWFYDREKKGSEEKVRVVTKAGGEILRDEYTDLDQLPFFRLPADVKPRQIYGDGWVKNLIPVNKELNRIVNHIVEYNLIMNRGKWIMDKGAGVRIINNENGQIIQKKRGYDLSQVPIAPLNPSATDLREFMLRMMEDIGGFHEASMGRIPSGAKSGRALETLQIGDANNMSEVVENIEVFLEEVYEYILSLAAKKYQFTRNVTTVSKSGEKEFMKVIGEEASMVESGETPDDAVVLPKKAMVDVRITSYLAQTTDAKQEKAERLYQLGVIDEQTLLEFYNVGNVADILDRVEKKRLKEQAEQLVLENQQAQIQGAQAPQTPQSGAQQAIAAIRGIINGQNPVIPDQVAGDFVGYIDSFLQTPEAQSLPDPTLQAIQAYRDEVIQRAP